MYCARLSKSTFWWPGIAWSTESREVKFEALILPPKSYFDGDN